MFCMSHAVPVPAACAVWAGRIINVAGWKANIVDKVNVARIAQRFELVMRWVAIRGPLLAVARVM